MISNLLLIKVLNSTNTDSPPLSVLQQLESKQVLSEQTNRWKVIMGKFAKQSKSGTPLFDGSNYAFWSIRMRAFIEAQGIELWQSIENGYKVPKTVPTNAGDLVQYNNNSRARNHLLSAIDESVFNKVMNCPSAKEMWDKLQTTYEGDHKVKEAKLQTYRGLQE